MIFSPRGNQIRPPSPRPSPPGSTVAEAMAEREGESSAGAHVNEVVSKRMSSGAEIGAARQHRPTMGGGGVGGGGAGGFGGAFGSAIFGGRG